MQLVTFNEVLTDMCNDFDTLISPKKIVRTNTNIIYLIIKAVSKGYEIINNVCVTLHNKFDPARCSEEDLMSVASLVGTSKLKGSASGLLITAYNSGDESINLVAGKYHYDADEDTTFTFEITELTTIDSKASKQFIAFSEKIGAYFITSQSNIIISSDSEISNSIVFSCADNKALLGTEEETNIEFRKRVLTETNRQDSITELQTAIRNQPYIFDARIKFNPTSSVVTYDEVSIPPYSMAIFYSGEAREELASLVASKSIYPTVSTNDSVELKYKNDVFINGEYAINVIPFKETEYGVNITYSYNPTYVVKSKAEDVMKQELLSVLNRNVHKDYITEEDIYNVLNSLSLENIKILNVDLTVDGTNVDYVSISLARIPKLLDSLVEFEGVSE